MTLIVASQHLVHAVCCVYIWGSPCWSRDIRFILLAVHINTETWYLHKFFGKPSWTLPSWICRVSPQPVGIHWFFFVYWFTVLVSAQILQKVRFVAMFAPHESGNDISMYGGIRGRRDVYEKYSAYLHIRIIESSVCNQCIPVYSFTLTILHVYT